jgi:sugar lactone lactonase YvrE
LYVADIDTIRWFDLKTGEPKGNTVVQGATRFNDIEVDKAGNIYATQTGDQNSDTWRLYKISPKGDATILVTGAPLKQPNGVAFDQKGNIVVVNIGSTDVLTFSPGRKADFNRTIHQCR